MKIWLLENLKYPIWDAYSAHVVMAKSPYEARGLAASVSHGNSDAWLDPKKTTCHEISKREKSGVILSSYIAG